MVTLKDLPLTRTSQIYITEKQNGHISYSHPGTIIVPINDHDTAPTARMRQQEVPEMRVGMAQSQSAQTSTRNKQGRSCDKRTPIDAPPVLREAVAENVHHFLVAPLIPSTIFRKSCLRCRTNYVL